MSKKFLMKPLKVLASPGIYLFGKYTQYKQERRRTGPASKQAEDELSQLNTKIDKLLTKLNDKHTEIAASPDEECIICVNAKAVMQTYPCGHKVVCRRCFVKTIQIALSQRTLPLRCIICRSKIIRLKHTEEHAFQYRSSSCSASRRGPSTVTRSRSLEENTSQESSSKYSRSLPGIIGGRFQYGSSVNRSYSAVMHRQSTTNTRKSYKSCSLSSCSSSKVCKMTKSTATKNRLEVNHEKQPYTRINENESTCMATEKAALPAAFLSREKQIQQFQRDFREGQLSSRSTSMRKTINVCVTSKRNNIDNNHQSNPNEKLETKHSIVEKRKTNVDYSKIDYSGQTTQDIKNRDKSSTKTKEKIAKSCAKNLKPERKKVQNEIKDTKIRKEKKSTIRK